MILLKQQSTYTSLLRFSIKQKSKDPRRQKASQHGVFLDNFRSTGVCGAKCRQSENPVGLQPRQLRWGSANRLVANRSADHLSHITGALIYSLKQNSKGTLNTNTTMWKSQSVYYCYKENMFLRQGYCKSLEESLFIPYSFFRKYSHLYAKEKSEKKKSAYTW